MADTARSLIRAGVTGDAQIEEIASRRLAPVTLQGRAHFDSPPMLLDPDSPIGESGLQSGWIIEPVLEFGARSSRSRLVEVAGNVEVLSGKHAGVSYSLIAGVNLIGRDDASRIQLSDSCVSRRHVAIEIGAEIVLHDMGSANGTLVQGEAVAAARIDRPCIVSLGDVDLRVTPGPPAAHSQTRSHKVMHTRVPRVASSFTTSTRELPSPPAAAAPNRIPVLAMLAPMLLGGAMFAITQSPMSLMMVAFSPLMMIGSWLDNTLGRKRKLRKELKRFEESMAIEREQLAALKMQEVTLRDRETPTMAEIGAAIRERGSLLWTRRPEHSAFLQVRFGEGTLPSRTEVTLPPRGETAREQWDLLNSFVAEFGHVEPVPVLEQFDRCGSVGITGEQELVEGMARSLILQLAGLHSPAELAIACFGSPMHVPGWAWLKWLPHTDAVSSPISAWQLTDDSSSSMALLVALEGLLEQRLSQASGGRKVRSHLGEETRNDEAQGEAVTNLPVLPSVIIVILEDELVDQSRLIALAEHGPDVGIHCVWVAPDHKKVPGACRTYLELWQGQGRVNFVRTGTTVPLRYLSLMDSTEAFALARSLAPVEDTSTRVLDETDLPKSVHLRELHQTDLVGGAQPILRAWEASGSLMSNWVPGYEREPVSLLAVVGQGVDGPATVDLRTHGPHALVGGTTGAGKSEFLQTWIMSMAARLSPERLNFLLVDYKGGAAFAECTDLPHTVGLVTDLNSHLVKRALTSLRAELHYREELLANHGAKDLITMERRSDSAAPPVLVIVIDEFAALANEVPEFVDGVIDIAQRGRSLGLHLIMATQRPAGVIKDNLRANTNLRVALRMADEADSSDVIGVTDAAFFSAETPGRGSIKIGPDKISHFQTGYLGGRAAYTNFEAQLEIRSLNFTEGEAWAIPPEDRKAQRKQAVPRDIEQLRDGIIEAANLLHLTAPRRPWLDSLPNQIDLCETKWLAAQHASEIEDEHLSDAAVIGLRDEPTSQSQNPVSIDLEESGNVALLGTGGVGKTFALITLAASLSLDAEKFPVEIYGVDAAGGALGVLESLPTVGAIASLTDIELVCRVLQHLLDLIAERAQRFAAAHATGLAEFRRTPGGEVESRVLLLIDGFGAFRQATETLSGSAQPFQMLSEIMATGRSVGVHVVLSAERPGSVPVTMASSIQQQFILRLANPHNYAQVGVDSELFENAPAGRAVLAGSNEEIHIALLGERPDLAGQAEALLELAASLRDSDVRAAVEVCNAPELVPIDSLPSDVGGEPVCGINTRTFEPVPMLSSGLAVISGPAGSGQSTAVLSCVEGFERWSLAEGQAVEKVLLTFSNDGLIQRGTWDRVARGETEVNELARELVIALGGTPPAGVNGMLVGPIGEPNCEGDSEPARTPDLASDQIFPLPGKRGVIVIEGSAESEGTQAFETLVALAKIARRTSVLVIFEFEQGMASGVWELLNALKQSRWGIALQPDENESQTPFRESLGRVKRADFPPGRGFAVTRGRVTPIHMAFPSAGVGASHARAQIQIRTTENEENPA
ncbi:FtsK/SpoIIIE domain-containing protein [Leucobacter denitrificans]|uniref:FtsK/SpoIIIE domain-containing protein n=1 Tax=Leucobacter denitrificans TaxID=683042 RepID=UPI001FE5F8A7|nr:FtsK/SpoIIIE domain-containing protein [Leucobacter denitrificans]